MNRPGSGAKRPLRYLSAALLALASSSALALGLGDIRVLSRPGQPLLAEIPVITADPAELQNLRVGLASAATFERVGLQAPAGLVSELQFELVRNAQGRAVVQVTSQAPVDTAALSFLVEADWGQGRLVREYSALVDRPGSAVAVAEPEIIAPASALPSTIVRDPAPSADLPAPAPAPAAPVAAAPRASHAAAPRAAALPTDGSITVQAGQTLSHIAVQVAREQQVGRDQAMIALLRANPEAFIRGNVNLLRQGAVLRLPDAQAVAAVDRAEAAAMVREHTAQWRQARTIPQPAAASDAAVATATAAAPATTDARLEIAPAAAAQAAGAGTTTGTGDGNEGDMLANEQLRQAREDVATREAEIDELKQRVAELEKLQQQQQTLVELKDTELAAAQARLAQAPAAAGSGPWYWLGVPVLLLAVAGWWLARRRKPSPLPPQERGQGDGSAMEAGLVTGAGLDVMAERAPWQDEVVEDEVVEDEDAAAIAAAIEDDVALRAPPSFVLASSDLQPSSAAQVWPDVAALVPADPADSVPAYALHAEQQPDFRGVFEYPQAHADAVVDAPEVEAETGTELPDIAAQAQDADAPAETWSASEPVRGGGHDRLELAIAYLDLGDAQTARALLLEVAQSEDLPLQTQARELLGRLD